MSRKLNPDLVRRRGAKLSDEERRTHAVSVRLNADELALLDKMRDGYQRGEWMRMALLECLPTEVPAANIELVRDLGKMGSNLNQIARHLNAGDPLHTVIAQLRDELQALRGRLLEGEE